MLFINSEVKMKDYSLTEEQKKQFAGIYLLEYIINKPHFFELLSKDEDSDLEPILEWLLIKEYIKIQDDSKYVPTEKGRETLVKFMQRYSEFLHMFDIFCAVDLNQGTFAFSEYHNFSEKDQWLSYLDDERWEDLRIAVTEFKKLNPIEIVFMSYINEGRFGRNHVGWQFDLLLGTVWDEILQICNSAIQVEDLGYDSEEGFINGEDVIKDIITQGAHQMIELLRAEKQFAKPIQHNDSSQLYNENDRVVDAVEPYNQPLSYYEPYYDPWYVPPILLGTWLL